MKATASRKAENISLTLSPMQWGQLRDIEDVEPLNEGDYACLAEVREVLKKHKKRDRFGVALLHKHFNLDEDEVLMESTDKENRVLTIQPEARNATGKSIETIWKLQDGKFETMTWCEQKCTYGMNGHDKGHKKD
jgi:hypothetical protein